MPKRSSAISLISTTGKIEENVNVVYNAGDVYMTIVKSVRKRAVFWVRFPRRLDDQRNDNELLVQLINKISLAGDHVREADFIDRLDEKLVMVRGSSTCRNGPGPPPSGWTSRCS